MHNPLSIFAGMSYTQIKNVVVGLAGGAGIEATDQLETVLADLAPAMAADGDPLDWIKILTQLIIAIGTLITLFKRPKQDRQRIKKPLPQDPADHKSFEPSAPTYAPDQHGLRRINIDE